MIKLEDLELEKSELRILVNSLSDTPFYLQFKREIYEELGYLEIHELDKKLLLIKNSGVITNTNNGNSYVSYLIGVTTIPPNGPLVKKGGSLPD